MARPSFSQFQVPSTPVTTFGEYGTGNHRLSTFATCTSVTISVRGTSSVRPGGSGMLSMSFVIGGSTAVGRQDTPPKSSSTARRRYCPASEVVV